MGDLRTPTQLDQYQLVSLVGRGPMCTVWRARTEDGDYALKVLDLPYSQDPAWVARFAAEARLAQSLVHPHIVPIHSVAVAPPHPYFVMDWLEGGNLTAFRKAPVRDLATVLVILGHICQALEYIHQRNLVHCDVKGSNVLLDGRGRGYLADFGMTASAAELSESGSRGGTIHYVSPEQFASISDGPLAPAPVDARSDIYSLGVMMYELMTGEPPFTASNRFALMYRRAMSDPRPPSAVRPELPAGVDAIVLKALARAPEGRYATAAEFREALRRLEASL